MSSPSPCEILRSCNDRSGTLFCRDGSRFVGKLRVEFDGLVALAGDEHGTKVFLTGLVAVQVTLDHQTMVDSDAESVIVQLTAHRSIDGVPVRNNGQVIVFAQATITDAGGDSFSTEVLDPNCVVLVSHLCIRGDLLRRIESMLSKAAPAADLVFRFDPFDPAPTSAGS